MENHPVTLLLHLFHNVFPEQYSEYVNEEEKTKESLNQQVQAFLKSSTYITVQVEDEFEQIVEKDQLVTM